MPKKSINFSILFTLFFVSMHFDKGENTKSYVTRHITRCQGTVERDTKCHALKITKLPYSNCSKIDMMKSNNKYKANRGLTSQHKEMNSINLLKDVWPLLRFRQSATELLRHCTQIG